MQNPFLIPGWKTKTGGIILIVSGLLGALGSLFSVLGNCLNGTLLVSACTQQLPEAFISVLAAASGLSFLGIGKRADAAKAQLQSIESRLAGFQQTVLEQLHR